MSGILNSRGITVRRGDSFAINFHFTDNIGDMDLKDTQLKMCVKKEDGSKVLEKNGVISIDYKIEENFKIIIEVRGNDHG